MRIASMYFLFFPSFLPFALSCPWTLAVQCNELTAYMMICIYICSISLTRKMDSHDVSRGRQGTYEEILGKILQPTLIIGNYLVSPHLKTILIIHNTMNAYLFNVT
jgi:hypothetical protein